MMKKLLLIIITTNCLLLHSQQFNLTIKGSSTKEERIIDSISYAKKHKNIPSILATIKKLDSTLSKIGFIEYSLKNQIKINDSTFNYTYYLGDKVNYVDIITNNTSTATKNILQITKDTITLPFSQVENWILNQLQLLEKKGYSLAKIKLTNQTKRKNKLISNLDIQLNSKRKTDALIILGYDKFPKNFKNQITKKTKNKVFNQELVSTIYDDFNALKFVTQIKYPEILFTEDKTNIYAYLNKSKPNKFDGYIGFSNDEDQKITFNGYLDLILINTLNSGEKFKIFWKNDGNEQTLFNLGVEMPFLFKTPLGIKTELNIFKQDSTFQNSKIDVNLGYSFSFNKRAYIGIQKTNSVDIQNTNSQSLSNFKNQFYTATFQYTKNNTINPLLPDKTNLFIRFGLGNRTTSLEKKEQFFTELELSHLIDLNKKNTISLKNNSYFLNSANFFTNELYRFGGINSIRGFRENSLQANIYSLLITEYRYSITPSFFIHSISDIGYFEDKTTLSKEKLLGLGIGIELLTSNGLLHFVYSNGSTNNQNIELSNSIIQISFKTNF